MSDLVDSLTKRVTLLEARCKQLANLFLLAQWQPQHKAFGRKSDFVECLWCHGELFADMAMEDLANVLRTRDSDSLRPVGLGDNVTLGHKQNCKFIRVMDNLLALEEEAGDGG